MQAKTTPHADTLQLWFARVSDLTLDQEQGVIPLFSESEADRLGRIKSHKKRREYLLSRALMRHALNLHFDSRAQLWEFVERSGATPFVANLMPSTHISLSHSGGLICFALSDCPVGIDIEGTRKRRKFSALAEVFMNAAELDSLAQDESKQADSFYRIWCAKEACFKALPAAKQATTALRKIDSSALIEGRGEWQLIEGKSEAYRFAAVLKCKPVNIDIRYYLPSDKHQDNFAIG